MTLRTGLALAAAAVAAAFPLGAAARAPARVQVVEREYSLTLSRLWVRSGPAIVNVVNFGQDSHDLVVVRRARGAKAKRVRTQVLRPHESVELHLRLAPGRYELYCSLPGHRAAGMRATLVVRR